jgi:hypothetical protein
MIDMQKQISDPPEVIQQMMAGELQVELILDGALISGDAAFKAIAGDTGAIHCYAKDETGKIKIDWVKEEAVEAPPMIGKVEIRPRPAQVADLVKRQEG